MVNEYSTSILLKKLWKFLSEFNRLQDPKSVFLRDPLGLREGGFLCSLDATISDNSHQNVS